MRVRAPHILVFLAAFYCGSAVAGAPDKIAYDHGARGVVQRVLGKKVRDGQSTHLYAPGHGQLNLARTETVEQKDARTITRSTTFRPLEERMTVAEAEHVLGGIAENGYLYRVSKKALAQLQLKAEIVEMASQRTTTGLYFERRYLLRDGVIEQWTNSNGTTMRTPGSVAQDHRF